MFQKLATQFLDLEITKVELMLFGFRLKANIENLRTLEIRTDPSTVWHYTEPKVFFIKMAMFLSLLAKR